MNKKDKQTEYDLLNSKRKTLILQLTSIVVIVSIVIIVVIVISVILCRN